jgi:hypothetical protein
VKNKKIKLTREEGIKIFTEDRLEQRGNKIIQKPIIIRFDIV